MRTTRSVMVRSLITLAASLAMFTTTADAQVVADGQTNTLDNVTNMIAGTVTVGGSGSFTLLVITNGGMLTNTSDSAIGYGLGAQSNTVRVTGANSRWFTCCGLYFDIGVGGSGNSLVISDGGRVSNSYIGIIGDGRYGGGNDNYVNVIGTNSQWNNGKDLYVGNYGSANALWISDAGKVSNNDGYIGRLSGANNNMVTVSGANSAWNNNSNVFIGYSGSFNTLRITNGGRVTNYRCEIGAEPGANGNQVSVNGTNSQWINSGYLEVGSFGAGNTLLIANAAWVASSSSRIGVSDIATNNQVTVTDNNSMWTNSGDLSVGFGCSFNALLISNGGQVANSIGSIGDFTDEATSNKVIVTGANSRWNNTSNLYVGSFGTGNTLLITNGGAVQAANAYVGWNNGNSSNFLLTVGSGTLTVTNDQRTAVLDVRSGSVLFNGSAITSDRFLLTNGAHSQFIFSSGTINVRTSAVANARTFIVGNGTSSATFNAVGGGTHSFANGLLIHTNGTLTGTGTINGSVTNCGTIFLTNADQMIFTGPVVNKGVIIAVTGTPRFGSTFTNLGTFITTASINVANVSVSGPDIVLQFNSVSNYLHEVQASTNVSSGLWQTLTNGLLGTGNPITFTDPGGTLSPNRTYRVLLH